MFVDAQGKVCSWISSVDHVQCELQAVLVLWAEAWSHAATGCYFVQTFHLFQQIGLSWTHLSQASRQLCKHQMGTSCDSTLINVPALQGKARSRARGSGRFTAKHTMVVVLTCCDRALMGLLQMQDKARSCARDVGVNPHEVEAVLGHVPPQVDVSRGPLEAAHWFNSRWLAALLQGELPACH